MNIDDIDSIDINEFEQQRYEDIKNRGSYLEVTILIDASDEAHESSSCMPILMTNMHNCTNKDIGILYQTCKSYIQELEKQHPLACLVSDLTLKTKDVLYADDVEKSIKKTTKKSKRKKEN